LGERSRSLSCFLDTRHEEVIRGTPQGASAGLLIEKVKRRVVRDRGGRPLARVSGYARHSAVGLPEVSSGEELPCPAVEPLSDIRSSTF
jgi:hypothetical protein